MVKMLTIVRLGLLAPPIKNQENNLTCFKLLIFFFQWFSPLLVRFGCFGTKWFLIQLLPKLLPLERPPL